MLSSKKISSRFGFGRLLPQEAGGRPGCFRLRFASVLYCEEQAVKELPAASLARINLSGFVFIRR